LFSVSFTVLRTIAVSLGMFGERTGDRMAVPQRAMISWFGIRGIRSVFYLMFALRHGVSGHLAQQLISFALVTVAASIVVHGVSVRLLMQWYMRRKAES
jgi:NhaP-type Na+/H+ or K+/H+ antiporter